MLFQAAALFDSMNVGENVAFGLKRRTDLDEAADRPDRRRQPGESRPQGIERLMPHELSGGMRKRVGLARAIAYRPEIILYDEPSTGLDPIRADAINDLILLLQKEMGVTSIVITHDMVSANKVADRIAMLYEGRIVAVGTPGGDPESPTPWFSSFSWDGPTAPSKTFSGGRLMSRKLKVGLFVGGTLAVAAVFILLVGDVAYLFTKPGFTLNVEVASAAGLDAKAVVKMAGVKIGYVSGIELSGIRARVVMAIESGVRVPDDSQATFATLGLIGEKYVEIYPGKSTTYCADGGIIQGSQKAGFDQVGELLSNVGGKLEEAAGSLRDTLDEETRTKLKAALDGAAGATEELRAFLAANRGGFQSLIQGADRTVGDVGRTVTEMAEKIDQTLAAVRDTVAETRDPLKADLAKIGEAVDKLRELLERIEKGEGTAGKLIRDPALYDEASRVLSSVQKAAGSLSGIKGYADFQAGYFGSSEMVRSALAAGLRLNGDVICRSRPRSATPGPANSVFLSRAGCGSGVSPPGPDSSRTSSASASIISEATPGV